MMKMNLLTVVTPPSIYHGCSTRKTFREEKFTGKEKLFSAVNMKSCGRLNVWAQMDIKGSDKYGTLDIPLKIDSLNKKKITSSESKLFLEKSGKGVDYLYWFQGQSKASQMQKGKVCHHKCQ